MSAKRLIQAAVVGAMTVVLLAFGAAIGFIVNAAGSSGAVSSTIVETGSSLQAPLFGEWAPAYQSVHTHVLVAAAATDSGTGIKDAENGLAAIGAADLPAPAAKGIISIPLTVAGVAVIYNLPGYPSVHLNGTVLGSIYSGKITRWNDPAIAALNSGLKLPDMAIRPLERADSSGTTFQFTSYLQAQSPTRWPIPAKTQNWPVGTGEQGSNAMVTGCAAVKGCVAYAGVSYDGVAQQQYHLQVAALADGSGKFLLPTRANIAAAVAAFHGAPVMINARNGYPVVNYEYAVVKSQQSSGQAAAAIRQFLRWAVTSGSTGKYLSALNFEPLPASALAQAQQKISEIR